MDEKTYEDGLYETEIKHLAEDFGEFKTEVRVGFSDVKESINTLSAGLQKTTEDTNSFKTVWKTVKIIGVTIVGVVAVMGTLYAII